VWVSDAVELQSAGSGDRWADAVGVSEAVWGAADVSFGCDVIREGRGFPTERRSLHVPHRGCRLKRNSARHGQLRRLGRCLCLGVGFLCAAAVSCRSATEPGSREVQLEVAESRMPCIGVGPQECLQVREQSDAPWQLFYDHIEGFAYEPGFRYVLRVAVSPVPDPPADGSSLAYRLLRVMSRTPAP